MDFQQELIAEYDRETAKTRKMLEAIPADADFTWKPHPKSMSLGQLAGHISDTAGEWAITTFTTDKLEFPADHKFKPYVPASDKAMLEKFDSQVAEAKAALASFAPAKWDENWKFIAGGQAWIDDSKYRGSLVVTLSVEVLSEGVHSGLAGGIVPSSFRLVRQLLSRIEDQATGEILVPECLAEPPARYLAAAETMAAELGKAALGEFPTVPSLEVSGRAGADRLLRRTWMPSLAVIGIDGVPSVKDGGNVLRPFTTAKLSRRLPPSVDAARAAEAVASTLSANPPQGARVKVVVVNSARGFDAPPQAEWLARATDEAPETPVGRRAGALSGEIGR